MTVLDVYVIPDTRDLYRLLAVLERGDDFRDAFYFCFVVDGRMPSDLYDYLHHTRPLREALRG